MECPSCHSPWSSEEHVPRILSCGHTTCELCCKSKFNYCRIKCEECKVYHKFQQDREFSETDEDYLLKCINTLSKNFTLLSIINSNKAKEDLVDEFEFDYCYEHNLPIHSYTPKPESMLCDKCIEEVQEMGLEIRPLDYVEEYFDGMIKKIMKNFKEKRQKIEVLIEKLIKNEVDEAENNEKLVSFYFDELLMFVEKNENEVGKKVEIKSSELRMINNKTLSQLDNVAEVLEDLNNQFNYLKGLSDHELVRKSELCDSLALTSISTPPIQSLKSLQFSSNKAKIAKLPSILEGSYKILIKKIPETWPCSKCEKQNQDGSIACSACKHFRPISSYPRLSSHPSLASDQELHELNLRRQLEIQKISQLDKIDPKGKYYLIHTGWFNKWKEFVLSKNSENKQSIILPPGQITNHLLFEDSQFKVIKSGLRAVNDYRGLNEEVWNAYLDIYGGGPTILRKKLNIYE